MDRRQAQDAIDNVLEDAEITLTIEEIAQSILGGYVDDPDLFALDEIAEAGRVLANASRLPLANPVPRDIGFFILAWIVERQVEWDHTDGDEELDRISAAIEEIEKAHGLADDEIFTPDDGPPEWEELNQQFTKRINELTIQRLHQFGQVAMADLYEQDPDKYYKRWQSGHSQLKDAVNMELIGIEKSIH